MLSRLLVLASAFAGLISAQGSIPQCATPCLANLPQNCNGDPKCICSSSSFISSITCCVISHCPDPADVEATRNYALAICKPAGVTSLPSGSQSCSSSGTSSLSTAASSSASSSPSSNPGGPVASATSSGSSSAAATSSGAASTSPSGTASSTEGGAASSNGSAGSTSNLATEAGGAAESATTAGNAPSATGAAVVPSVFLQGFGLLGAAGAAMAVL